MTTLVSSNIFLDMFRVNRNKREYKQIILYQTKKLLHIDGKLPTKQMEKHICKLYYLTRINIQNKQNNFIQLSIINKYSVKKMGRGPEQPFFQRRHRQ